MTNSCPRQRLMGKPLIVLLALVLLVACKPAVTPQTTAEQLQKQALESDAAWQLLSSLVNEVGARMGGSSGDAQAVAWARATMKPMGFDRVWLEHVEFPRWLRGQETGRILDDAATGLDLTAIGGSPGTDGPISAEIVHFENLEALQAAPAAAVTGKIALITEQMQRSRDGSGYGHTVRQRSKGPFEAARKGALALLIRSVGTDPDGPPHTGMLSSTEPGEPVPSAALSHASTDLLLARLQAGDSVHVELNLDCGFDGLAVSQNVIGEFDGRNADAGFVVIGGHLDSWDLGSGAHDDGAGVAITLSAAQMIMAQSERPPRGIRVVLFANEEQGVYGGKAYALAHAAELDQHLLGAESDLGAGRIFRFLTRVDPAAEPAILELEAMLAPLGIERVQSKPAGGGADLGQMRKLGMPAIDLSHDASRYFDLHHTANDTLDNVEPADLQFNVAAWVTFLHWATNSTATFGPVPVSE